MILWRLLITLKDKGGYVDLQSVTIALGVMNPEKLAQWYSELLGCNIIRFEDQNVYEVIICDNIWIQFYFSENRCMEHYIRLGVDDLEKIVKQLKERGYSNCKIIKNGTVQYIYSIQDIYGNKLGFYQINDT
jgi:hypothetical protein